MIGPADRLVYRNPLDLPRVSRADIVNDALGGVYVEPPGTARVFCCAAPRFHDDPDNAGLFAPFHEQDLTSPAGLAYRFVEGLADDPDPATVHKPRRVNIPARLQRIASLA